MFKRIVSAALVFGMAALAPPAGAQVLCTGHHQVAQRLTGVFGETPHGIGLISPSEIIELWTSAKTRTWTLLFTRADGTACVIATGTGWMSTPSEAPEGRAVEVPMAAAPAPHF